MSKFIVDHMEDGMHEWCVLEYKHMIMVVGKDNMYFSSLSDACLATMPEELKEAHLHKEDTMHLPGIDPKEICLLDPSATEPLKPEDADTYKYFLFGGILGDDPPRDRTKELRKLGFAGRHLGPIQMSTDTAVNVTKRVVVDKVPLDKVPYIDSPEVFFSKHESVNLPYRYIAETKEVTTKDGQKKTIRKPIMPPGMMELIKKDSERTLDF
ncbi:SAM-dependent RNA methyltransferase [Zychaea mexicana]|uniref:SAM-dependent RNA methyltransferase n=1 Tax=Zychaea mexicana TaxID=64656 RepID=UPI0022FE727E|nr:SAM-dependent RNA methyltransferase [Zychaea mexicana]KAI9495024.1 SAM-dependent RNA methyltransferase [Zychaea mexicana]